MKVLGKLVLALLIAGGSSCEDVVQVDVPTEPPRLIVDALIRVDENAPSTTIRVKVLLTSSFFGTVPLTGLKDISFGNVGDDRYGGGVAILLENPEGSGIYEREIGTEGILDGQLILQLNHEGRLYFARTRYAPAVPIDTLEQGNGTLFEGDETEVVVTFTDDPERDNFYVFDFDFDEFLVTEDEFYKGQEFKFSYFYDRELESGREITISVLGADLSFYNYMDQLIEQSGDLAGPFQTPAATVKGNVFDVSNLDNVEVFDNVDQPDNFPLGYFAVVQEYKKSITIQ